MKSKSRKLPKGKSSKEGSRRSRRGKLRRRRFGKKNRMLLKNVNAPPRSRIESLKMAKVAVSLDSSVLLVLEGQLPLEPVLSSRLRLLQQAAPLQSRSRPLRVLNQPMLIF